MENNIIKSKAKEFLIVFGKVLFETLIAVFLLALAIVPCIILQTGYFIIPWIMFIISLYLTIFFVFIDPFRNLRK